MNAAILCVGKLKEKWQQEGVNEYLKRLSRYGKYEIVQVDDLREPENASDAQIRQVMEKEGRAILARIRPEDRAIALCIRAGAPDSVQFSRLMQNCGAMCLSSAAATVYPMPCSHARMKSFPFPILLFRTG